MIREASMSVQSPAGEPATGLSDLLAIGFGTTVAMWAVGYVGHMPLTDVPPLVFVSLMLVCLAAGGWITGRKTPRGVRGGLGLGLIVALLNLLVLGSVLAKPNTGQLVPQAVIWVPGYFAVCLALAAAGAAAGMAFRPHSPRPPAVLSRMGEAGYPVLRVGVRAELRSPDWLQGFAWTACVATLLLISIGGLVTGFAPGWPCPTGRTPTAATCSSIPWPR